MDGSEAVKLLKSSWLPSVPSSSTSKLLPFPLCQSSCPEELSVLQLSVLQLSHTKLLLHVEPFKSFSDKLLQLAQLSVS